MTKATPKNKNSQNNAYCPLSPYPLYQFSTQSSQYQNWNANMYSLLTVNELGRPVLESSTRISKCYAPTDSERKFNKTEIENWLPIGYNLGSSWLETRSYNHYSSLGLQLYENKTPPHVFSCKICEIFKNTYFAEYMRTTASVVSSSWLYVPYLRHRFINQK